MLRPGLRKCRPRWKANDTQPRSRGATIAENWADVFYARCITEGCLKGFDRSVSVLGCLINCLDDIALGEEPGLWKMAKYRLVGEVKLRRIRGEDSREKKRRNNNCEWTTGVKEQFLEIWWHAVTSNFTTLAAVFQLLDFFFSFFFLKRLRGF